MRDPVKNYPNDNQVVSSSTSANVNGISFSNFQLIQYELISAMGDPEMSPEWKERLNLAYFELKDSVKGGVR